MMVKRAAELITVTTLASIVPNAGIWKKGNVGSISLCTQIQNVHIAVKKVVIIEILSSDIFGSAYC